MTTDDMGADALSADEAALAKADDSVSVRTRLRTARDYLIDVEDQLLYVVPHDPSIQPLIDRIVQDIMDLTRRVE